MDGCLHKHLLALKVAFDHGDHLTIRTQAQSLKGASSYIRCDRVGKAAELLRNCIDKKDASIGTAYARLVKECIIFKRELRKYICEREGSKNIPKLHREAI